MQERLAAARPEPIAFDSPPRRTAGCYVCFPRGAAGAGAAGDPAWAAAALCDRRRLEVAVTVTGKAGAPYEPGLLALREGPLLEAAVRALPERPEVLLVDATAADHPRGAGLALQLGAVLDLPTIGVTHRPLVATGAWPEAAHGATSPLMLDGRVAGCWLRTRGRARPIAVHPGWRIDLASAVAVVMACSRTRTPEPLRRARRAARVARSRRYAKRRI
jgi:deoxyribonuclease V